MRAGPPERGPDVVPPARAPEPTGRGEPADLPDLPGVPRLPDLPDLPDLAGLALEELLDAPNPVLARAARRVLDRLMAEEAPLAAYNSSAVPIDDPPV
jgi:FXSXX-COOH protein